MANSPILQMIISKYQKEKDEHYSKGYTEETFVPSPVTLTPRGYCFFLQELTSEHMDYMTTSFDKIKKYYGTEIIIKTPHSL